MNNLSKTLLTAFVFAGVLQSSAQQKTPGIDTALMDKSVRPQDNFYQYVNGTWLKNTPIPADKTRWGSFDQLRQNTDIDALNILKDAASGQKYASNTDQGKAINLYKTIMDTVSRNKKGIEPIKPYLKQINSVKNVKDLQKLLMKVEAEGGGIGFYGFGIGPDDKNSNRNMVSLGPGRLGLPDRDYYLSEDNDSKEKREKYKAHVARMFTFLGKSPEQAKAEAEKVLAIETAMSQPRLDRVERRDARKQYNPTAIADLQKMVPSINWKKYLEGIGIKNIDTVIVSQPRYMAALQTIFTANKVEEWKAYMNWNLLNSSASMLSTEIGNANFEFYGKTLTGAMKQRPLDERALQTVNNGIGEALGKLYVEKMFPAEAKTKAEKMIRNVIRAYEIRIKNLTWMSEPTKKQAIEKLEKLTIKIGYPDTWKNYSALAIQGPADGGSYFQNMENITQWNWKKDLAKLGKPVDKTEWLMSPQTVNAYYNPPYNEIVFPAAILQPPFYNYQADEAVNYGGIGAVIGHEISHGFDDQGATFNADGNLENWWTEADLKQFTDLGTALANQFSVLEPLPGVKVDGKFTLGENIGDLGGINAAYDGLQLFLKENGNPGLIDGYTPEQRLFISWATIWRTKTRDEALKNQVKTDSHAPGMYRGYVPLMNLETFHKAFDIKPGDGMYLAPEKRVIIW
ncbi:MAG: M13 family metallopeptidase [Flavobacterium sp.]